MLGERINGYPVLIIGAGRGGLALLEMFLEDTLVEVIAVVDINPDAAGMVLARQSGIPVYTDALEALNKASAYAGCIVYNLSHDDSIAAKANQIFGDQRVASGNEVKLFWQMVTNLKQVKVELEKSQNHLQSVIKNVMDGIITIGESGDIQGFNPAAEKIFGYTQQEIFGKNVSLLMPEPDKSKHDAYIGRYLRTGSSNLLGVRGREVTAVRKNGEAFPMEMSISEMTLAGLRYFVGIVRDISERKLAEQKIIHLAHHDYLTGLPNRAKFLSDLDHSLLLAKRNNYKVATLFLDLDGFKRINDTLGHDAGDLLLQEVARRVKKVIRDSDTVARMGGDEFTFILDNIGSDENVALVTSKIIEIISMPMDLKGKRCQVSGSIGVSVYPQDGDSVAQLINRADEAMYLAKHVGKNTYRFYQDVLRGLG